jgi:large subunit ribosomal protein L20
MSYAYRDRKVKKREYRSLWIVRVNAACREEGIAYSRFMNGLKNAKVEINRKMLAELAVSDPDGFRKLVEVAKQSMSQPAAQPVNA